MIAPNHRQFRRLWKTIDNSTISIDNRQSTKEMASLLLTKKKQDEANQKVLRELAALNHNKHCFDCNQRGPTYVNVTIGSFVCTKCSGLLRGLTPPHRVKSISMATFSADEMELVKGKGNNHCRRTWLGLYENNNNPEFRNEHVIRDFMVDKYDRKMYYLDINNVPDQQQPQQQQQPSTGNFKTSTSTIAFAYEKNNVQREEQREEKPVEFIADFKFADIYNANENNNINDPKSYFTNFEDFPLNCYDEQNGQTSFESNRNIPIGSDKNKTMTPSTTTTKTNIADRYAALEDLDNAFKASVNLDWSWSFSDTCSPIACLNLSTSPNSLGETSNQGVHLRVDKNPFNSVNASSPAQPQTNEQFATNSTTSYVRNINPFSVRETTIVNCSATNPFL